MTWGFRRAKDIFPECSTVIETEVKAVTQTLDHIGNFVQVRVMMKFMLQSVHKDGGEQRN